MPVIASKTHADRPRRTIRLRLALLYGALFLVSGAALLGITYGLVVQRTQASGTISSWVGGVPPGFGLPVPQVVVQSPDGVREVVRGAVRQTVIQTRTVELRELLTVYGLALVVMACLSVLLGWLVAGRALRPVRAMTGKARRLSEANLHERLAVTGPNDELKDLGDTFDGLLARLDSAFEAQKRFVANASHELRTPLTLQRAMIEVALADPDADAESLRAVCQRVLIANDEQARLIEALLTLARSQRGLDEWQPVNLGDVVGNVRGPSADGVQLDYTLDAAWTTGDERLVERLVTNLLDNATRHNVPGGWVSVFTGMSGGRPTVRVTNSGRIIPADQVGLLLRPFGRHEQRTAHDGHGLGLSIVAAIATAHHADLTATPIPDGGLAVTVTFPARTNDLPLDPTPEPATDGRRIVVTAEQRRGAN